MAVDRNLFLHDLAIVAIMKNEAPYLKERASITFIFTTTKALIIKLKLSRPTLRRGLSIIFLRPAKPCKCSFITTQLSDLNFNVAI